MMVVEKQHVLIWKATLEDHARPKSSEVELTMKILEIGVESIGGGGLGEVVAVKTISS